MRLVPHSTKLSGSYRDKEGDDATEKKKSINQYCWKPRSFSDVFKECKDPKKLRMIKKSWRNRYQSCRHNYSHHFFLHGWYILFVPWDLQKAIVEMFDDCSPRCRCPPSSDCCREIVPLMANFCDYVAFCFIFLILLLRLLWFYPHQPNHTCFFSWWPILAHDQYLWGFARFL